MRDGLIGLEKARRSQPLAGGAQFFAHAQRREGFYDDDLVAVGGRSIIIIVVATTSMFFGVFVVVFLLVALQVGHVERERFVRLWSRQKNDLRRSSSSSSSSMRCTTQRGYYIYYKSLTPHALARTAHKNVFSTLRRRRNSSSSVRCTKYGDLSHSLGPLARTGTLLHRPDTHFSIAVAFSSVPLSFLPIVVVYTVVFFVAKFGVHQKQLPEQRGARRFARVEQTETAAFAGFSIKSR